MSKKKRILLQLSDDYNEPVRDPLWKNIYLTSGMKHLLSSPPMQKLHGIKQLGPTYLVYPGATHTRFSHSLGVFCLAKRIIGKLVSFEDCLDLEEESVRSFLCAALLHDLGHFPYAHSLKELPLVSHETLTARMILEEPLKTLLRDQVQADPYTAAAIVDESLDDQGRGDIRFFRRILSGTLDPDKLDYLNRDAFYCGVPYGIQDTEFVLDRLKPYQEGICITSRGLPALENILFSKYLMYRTVYWHKTVRVATAMIKHAVFAALREGVLRPEELYGLEDEEFHRSWETSSFRPFHLLGLVRSRRLYKAVLEIPFLPEKKEHRDLFDLRLRRQKELETADALIQAGVPLDREDCIIDVPEEISFTLDIPVTEDGEELKSEHLTPFSGPTVEQFRRSLRYIRLMLPSKAAEALDHPADMISWQL
ncbi:MAG: HD domain-containing protein [Spirochaetales bacterium]|nr:HD domain-containing protein [Spirochaetales bacterium]